MAIEAVEYFDTKEQAIEEDIQNLFINSIRANQRIYCL
jgi:hypothetical protein